MDLTNEIMAYALKNAIEFNKCESSKILPKLFQHGLEKKDTKEIMPAIQQIVDKVNSLDEKQRIEEFEKYKNYIKEREEKEKTLPELKNAIKGKVVTRLPPEPSKYLHIGHALSFLLNYIYAKRYDGKCLLRFEDCNPEKVSLEYIESNLYDIENYLEIKYDEIKYVSDDMPLLLDYAKKLIEIEKAYMCFCERESMQKLRHAGQECPCRNKSVSENIDEWEKFKLGEYNEGEAVLRIKGDMKSLNHVMRDSVIFRAVKAKHYKYGEKYKVWPMYDFYNPIEDSIMGITHILRSNEFEQRVELADYIKELLNLNKQEVLQYGRFNVLGSTTKGREIRELIESKEILGWDDPRLVTLKALKRRGIQKESLYELANQTGLSKYQVNIDFDMIAAINRKIIDPKALRYSFVKEPVLLKIKNAPDISKVQIPVHPNKPQELKEVKIDLENISISKEDYEKYKGKELRLIHLYNIKISDNNEECEFTSSENKNIQKINWVCNGVKTKIMMPNAEMIEGISENEIKKLNEGDIIQFERFGFSRLDKINKNIYEFWFAHK